MNTRIYGIVVMLVVGCAGQPMIDDVCTSVAFSTAVEIKRADGSFEYVKSLGPVDASVPDKNKTPGAYWKQVTLEQIKQPNYSQSVRDVPESLKREVVRRYGLTEAALKDVEIDHLVPLSWGGSNAIENLWPQPYAGERGARVKDRLEVHGLKLIRDGKLDWPAAKKEIADDWPAMYRRLLGPEYKAVMATRDQQ
jgi:hypothetical protein